MKNIIVRKDLRHQAAVFDADSETETTIKMWNGVHGAQWEEVSLAYYKSTVPVEDQGVVEKLIKGFTSNFGEKEIVVRQRLIKRTTVKGAATTAQAGEFDKEAFKRKFLKAIEKALESV